MSEWKHNDLGQHVILITKGTTPMSLGRSFQESGINFIKAESITDSGRIIRDSLAFIDHDTHSLLKRSQLISGDVLFSIAGVLGRVTLVGGEFIPANINQALALIRVKDKHEIDRLYLKYYLTSDYVKQQVRRINVQAAQANFSLADVNGLLVKYPKSIEVQRKIATILSTVDEVIEKTEATIEKYKAIKAGMMQDLFTRGIDVKTRKLRPSIQQVPELYKETELGWIPKEWEVFVFDDVIKEYFDFRGKTPLKLGLNWGGGSIKAISANNVEPGFINFSKEHYLASEDLYRVWMNRGDCSLGDVVMTSEAPLGVIAQIPDNQKYILSQRVFLFKANPSFVTDDYLYYLMNTDKFQNDLIRQSSGSTVIGIQQARLAKIKILLTTSIDEQRHISKILKSIDRTITDNDNMLGKYKNLKQGLMVDLLTGKVRVKINEDKLENS